jgi:hypothetical protein
MRVSISVARKKLAIGPSSLAAGFWLLLPVTDMIASRLHFGCLPQLQQSPSPDKSRATRSLWHGFFYG